MAFFGSGEEAQGALSRIESYRKRGKSSSLFNHEGQSCTSWKRFWIQASFVHPTCRERCGSSDSRTCWCHSERRCNLVPTLCSGECWRLCL